MTQALRSLQTSRAFDGVAAQYHRSNTANPILRQMRDRAVATLRRHVPAGSRVLDLGCGPGTDHAAMVQAGYLVTAIDASQEMVRRTLDRATAAGQRDRVSAMQHPIEDVASLEAGTFDAAFSDFGALNCVADLQRVAFGMLRVLRPGGVLVASVIGRVCPWELALYIARGDPARAFVRWRSGMVPVPLGTGTVWTQYYTPGQFTRVFARAGFTCEGRRALGLCAPPPYLDAFAGRHAGAVSTLFAVDDWIGQWPICRAMGDHFIVVLRRG